MSQHLPNEVVFLGRFYSDTVEAAGLQLPEINGAEPARIKDRSPEEVAEFGRYFAHLTRKTSYLEDVYEQYVQLHDERLGSVRMTRTARGASMWALASIARGELQNGAAEGSTRGVFGRDVQRLSVIYSQNQKLSLLLPRLYRLDMVRFNFAMNPVMRFSKDPRAALARKLFIAPAAGGSSLKTAE